MCAPREFVLLACLVACADAGESADPCAGSALTWSAWGAGFFAGYCRPCHSVEAPNRYGAPSSSNFDEIDEVRAQAERIRVRVLDEGTMPVGGGVPEDELRQLDEFLDCGL
jgi:hypothetical protein